MRKQESARTVERAPWRKFVAAGMVVAAFSGCAMGERASPPRPPEAVATQEATSTPESVQNGVLLIAGGMFDRYGSDKPPKVDIDQEFGGVYYEDSVTAVTLSDYNCTSRYSVGIAGVRVDTTCQQVGDESILRTINSGYMPASGDVARKLERIDSDGRAATSRQELFAMINRGELVPETTILSTYDGYDDIRTYSIGKDGKASYNYTGKAYDTPDNPVTGEEFAVNTLREIDRIALG